MARIHCLPSTLMSRLRTTLADAHDLLLSHNSTQKEYDGALEALERVLASLALDSDEPPPTPDQPTLLDAFLALQDGFEHNSLYFRCTHTHLRADPSLRSLGDAP